MWSKFLEFKIQKRFASNIVCTNLTDILKMVNIKTKHILKFIAILTHSNMLENVNQ